MTLLCMDIGNTNVTLGVFDGDTLAMYSRLATDRARTPDQYAAELDGIFALHGIRPTEIGGAVIGSVVPELTPIIGEAVTELAGLKALVVGPGVKTGLHIATDDPAQVGADLVAAAVAVAAKYPLPCIIADLGTATKISVINKDGAFTGCSIAAGIAISLESLSRRTSQLPAINLALAPVRAAGKNTIDSMRSGTIFGTAAMLDGMFERMEEELGSPVESAVATGGFAPDIVRFCKKNVTVDRSLILDGLKIIYSMNRRNG